MGKRCLGFVTSSPSATKKKKNKFIKNKSLGRRRCRKRTLAPNGLCQCHRGQVLESCGICLERLLESELVSCGVCSSRLHENCLMRAADSMQVERQIMGYPPLHHGSCPYCRADLVEVKVAPFRFTSEFCLTQQTMRDILVQLDDRKWKHLAEVIWLYAREGEELKGATEEDVRQYCCVAALVMWLNDYSIDNLPESLTLAQTAGGSFSCVVVK